MSGKLVLIIFIILAGYYWQREHTMVVMPTVISLPPGTYDQKLSIDKPPIQKQLEVSSKPLDAGDYTITPLASFQLQGRVLATENYNLGREADLAPVDLALGWGPMSRTEVLDTLDITQSGRFYHWHTDNFIIPRREIETNSANMHIIPATPLVRKRLQDIEEGDTVKFKGYLVRVDASDGWRWISSTTREDTGRGACELILVDDITLL